MDIVLYVGRLKIIIIQYQGFADCEFNVVKDSNW